jgi:hypothetical protein
MNARHGAVRPRTKLGATLSAQCWLPSSNLANPDLKGRLSAVLRDQLIDQLKDIDSSESAAIWARRILPAKDSLASADAQQLEDAFTAKIAAFDDGASRKTILRVDPKSGAHSSEQTPRLRKNSVRETIDKSELAHPEQRRIRDREHVRFVIKQPCLICGRTPSDSHHLRFAQYRALGRKVSDEFTVPLCRGHHREVHRCGDEPAWWRNADIDPAAAARALWLKIHPLPNAPRTEGMEACSQPAADPTSGAGQSLATRP